MQKIFKPLMGNIAYRPEHLQQAKNRKFDVIIIGGGITGAGVLLDLVSRGLSVLLIEKNDFASGTSSRSTKLIHGGLRYLKELDIRLVREVGRERKIVYQNSRHLTNPEKMIMPVYENGPMGMFMVRIGMSIYEWLAGVGKKEKHRMLNRNEVLDYLPGIKQKGLLGGVIFYEYRTDDARLTMEVLKSAADMGAVILNYAECQGILKENGKVKGVRVLERIHNEEFDIKASIIINATGPWADNILEYNEGNHQPLITTTKGIHIVFDRSVLELKESVYLDTPDKRMIFFIPREGKTYIGTTDTFYSGDLSSPHAERSDIDYLLKHISYFFPDFKGTEKDIESSWAGLRPLITSPGKKPGEISRKEELLESATGLITIAGGKLTGYRVMAKKTADLVFKRLGKQGTCKTRDIPLHGEAFNSWKEFLQNFTIKANLKGVATEEAIALAKRYGSDAEKILSNTENGSSLLEAELDYLIHNEMLQSSSDYFHRRTGLLLFSRKKASAIRQEVHEILRKKLSWNEEQAAADLQSLQESWEQTSVPSV